MRFLVFFTVLLSLVGLAHVYVYRRMVRDCAWSPRTLRWAKVLFLLLWLAVPLGMMLRLSGVRGAFFLSRGTFVWVGVLLIFTTTLLLVDTVKLVLRAVYRFSHGPVPPPPASRWALLEDPSRRIFLGRTVAGVTVLATAGQAALGVAAALGEVDVREVPIQLPKLPSTLSGLVVVQITDLHVHGGTSPDYMRRLSERISALKPDLFCITGDLVDGPVSRLSPLIAPLGQVRTRFGRFFAPGNHEHYAGAAAWLAHLPTLGITPLVNTSTRVGDGPKSQLCLLGQDDFAGRPDLGRALADVKPDEATILLAHQPKAILKASRADVGLVLSGHTHGGQIFPLGALVRLQQPYLAGLHTHGASQIYVSRGTGFWGPPMRVGAPAEVTKIVISPA